MRLTCKTANGYCDMQIATRENKLKKLEKSDITKGKVKISDNKPIEKPTLSETERIIKQLTIP